MDASLTVNNFPLILASPPIYTREIMETSPNTNKRELYNASYITFNFPGI